MPTDLPPDALTRDSMAAAIADALHDALVTTTRPRVREWFTLTPHDIVARRDDVVAYFTATGRTVWDVAQDQRNARSSVTEKPSQD